MGKVLVSKEVLQHVFRVLALLLVGICAAALLAGCESSAERAAGYLAKAEQFYEDKNFVKAELEVRNALQIEPKNADARFLLAQIAESRQDYAEMATQLRAAVESRPDFLEARLKLGTLYVLGQAIGPAEDQLAVAANQAPDDPGVRVLRAGLLAAKGELEAASTELKAALEQDPGNTQALGPLASVVAVDDPEAALVLVDRGIASSDDDSPLRLLKIQLLQRAGRNADVVAEYRALISEFPDQDVYSYQLARFLVGVGRVDEVEAVLQDLIRSRPDDNQAKLALVQFISGMQGAEPARALLQEFVDAEPDEHKLRLALGAVLQSTGQEDKAIGEYEYITNAAGNDDEALTAKGRLAALRLAKGDEEAGEALIEEVLAVDSLNSQALLLRGALHSNRKEFGAAVSDLRNLLRNDSENVRAQLLLAQTHTRAGDDMLAKDAYRRVIEMSPNNAIAPIELVRLLVKEKELEQAEEILKTRLKQAPSDITASRSLIALLLRRERYTDAEEEAVRLASIPETQAVGEYLRGSIYQVREQHERALSAFGIALELEPNAREPLQGTIASLIQLERNDEAVAMLESIMEQYPDNLYAQTLLSQVLAGSGDVTAAKDLIENTLSSNEEWLPAYTALAGMQGGDVDAQISIYKRGLEAMPASQELALLLGTAYEREGKYEDAIAAYEKVLEVDSELLAVRNNLAALLADFRKDRGSLERALELAEGLEDTGNPAFVDTLGWVHYRLGNFEEAVPLLEEAVEQAGQIPVLRYHLGMAYLADGKNILAEEQLALATADADLDFIGRREAQNALNELRSR
ncbi:MAG: tetratricopeptide repeat protein [Gammaproteobacteria bacterium]|jgi:tetratricopeptide (TPR) repeat protein|nr:tetratricopeptide repeat protein [Gammaproteobacteria bacterium]